MDSKEVYRRYKKAQEQFFKELEVIQNDLYIKRDIQ